MYVSLTSDIVTWYKGNSQNILLHFGLVLLINYPFNFIILGEKIMKRSPHYIYIRWVHKYKLICYCFCFFHRSRFIYTVATLSPVAETWDPPAAVPASFLDATEHLSILSSWTICCCLHSRLQKALSPLPKHQEPNIIIKFLHPFTESY